MTPARRWLIGSAIALSCTGLVAGCQASGQTLPSSPHTNPPFSVGKVGNEGQGIPGHFVRRHGTNLILDGARFRFVGFNLFDAAGTARYSCDPSERMSGAQLNAAMHYMHYRAGATVMRFWAYQTYTNGGTYWAGVDRVLRLARKNHLKVIPVLEDGPGYCTTGPSGVPKTAYAGDTWYSNGYKVPYDTAPLSYLDYVQRIVTRYRNDPTILGWMMMNEAETTERDAQGRSELVDFATRIGSVIKSIDPNHLLTVGTQSNGAPGASGPDFTAVYSVKSVDFAEVHDWAYYGSDTEAMPGSTTDGKTPPSATSTDCVDDEQAKIGCSFSIAKTVLHKPIIVGEAGIAATNPAERARRAGLLDAKMRADFAAGASGYLVWEFNRVEDSQHYAVLAADNDPLVPQMRALALRLDNEDRRR